MKGREYIRADVKVRYNKDTKRYEERIDVPADQLVVLSATMDTMVNCANCGKQIKYRNTYTSKKWYDTSGVWGLAVCPECFEWEQK